MRIVTQRWRQAGRAAAAQVDKGLLHGGGPKRRFFVGVGGKYIEAQHDVGFGQVLRRPKAGPVQLNGLHHLLRCKVRCKGIRQPQRGGQLCPIQAGAQNPDRNIQALTWHGMHRIFGVGRKVIHQLQHITRKLVSVRTQVAAQGACGDLVRTGCPAQPQVNAAGVERLQRAKLFCNHQWRVVRQHDAACTDPNGAGASRHMANQNRCGGAGNARHAVVLRQPVALITPGFGVLGQVKRVAKRLRGIAALRNRGVVEN